MRGIKSLLSLAAGVLVLGAFAPLASAESITVTNVTVAAGTGSNGAPVGDFLYTYSVDIGAGNSTSGTVVGTTVTGGDYLNILDFGGLVGTPIFASSLGGLATVSDPLVGPTGTFPAIADNGSIHDILVYLSGQTNTNTFASVSLGTLTAVTSSSVEVTGDYGSLDHNPADGPDLNGDNTGVPSGHTPPSVPVPASLYGGGVLMAVYGFVKFKFGGRSLIA